MPILRKRVEPCNHACLLNSLVVTAIVYFYFVSFLSLPFIISHVEFFKIIFNFKVNFSLAANNSTTQISSYSKCTSQPGVKKNKIMSIEDFVTCFEIESLIAKAGLVVSM